MVQNSVKHYAEIIGLYYIIYIYILVWSEFQILNICQSNKIKYSNI